MSKSEIIAKCKGILGDIPVCLDNFKNFEEIRDEDVEVLIALIVDDSIYFHGASR